MKILLLIYIISMVYCWNMYMSIPIIVALRLSKENEPLEGIIKHCHTSVTVFSIVPVFNTMLMLLIVSSSFMYFLGLSKKVNASNIHMYILIKKFYYK
jgi:hypothetical protein